MTTEYKRKFICAEAESYIGTPWHHEGRVKGHGVDCGMLLLEVYEAAGIIPRIVPEQYPADFMMHRNTEWFLGVMQQYGDELTGGDIPQPGDAIIYRYGRIYSHGGVVIDWPRIIHASAPDRAVVYADALKYPLVNREYKVFRPKQFIGGAR